MYANGNGVTRNAAEAVKWLRMAARDGYSLPLTNLGDLYAMGKGVPKDGAEAVKWYRMAAANGSADAQSKLGLMYDTGDLVLKDGSQAVKWYRMAAFNDDTQAQFNLGTMYASGKGVPKDEIEGLAWMNIAAVSDEEQCIKARDLMERRIGREGTLVAQQRSKEILKEIKAANAQQENERFRKQIESLNELALPKESEAVKRAAK
jgi:hypothetical protein